jgi:hypothetical protein
MTALVTMLVLAVGFPVEAAPALPLDARLEPVRARLQQMVQKAESEGLPAEMIVGKVREGLAKGIDATRIEAAASRLADNLGAAQKFVAARRPGPAPAPLVRALAEARQAGVELAAVDSLVRNQKDTGRAVEVVIDLARRGYPADRAAVVVQNVLTRDARSLDRVPGTLETIRQDYTLSHVEAVDALARGLSSADSLQTAYHRTAEDERQRGHGKSARAKGGGEGEGAGKIPPGQLKKRGLPFVPPGKNKM